MTNININLPSQVTELLNRLNAYSYKAYIAGRCVRELLSGQGGNENSVDYDIITNADIDRVHAIFEIYSLNIDNIENGEVIVNVAGVPVLIAPYKKAIKPDGKPIYTDVLEEDLRRRDFSFNAIAYNPREGFVDPFGGITALSGELGVVEVIADNSGDSEDPDAEPITAFERNPVSILQALGYYSSGEYLISERTKNLMNRHKECLSEISQTDLRTELSWVLRGKKVSAVLEEYSEVITVLFPEFETLKGFDLKRPEHSFDALTHTFKSVGYASPILLLRYALLFHALGIPDCFSEDEDGKGNFHGHAERSWLYARKIMRRWSFSDDQIREVGFLIKNQGIEVASDKRSLKLKLREMPPERLKMLLQFKYADLRAKSPEFEGAAMICKRQVDTLNEIVTAKECYTVQQLAVNRYDLMQKGMVKSDEQARVILEKLLDMVTDAPAFNTRMRLMNAAEKLLNNTRG